VGERVRVGLAGEQEACGGVGHEADSMGPGGLGGQMRLGTGCEEDLGGRRDGTGGGGAREARGGFGMGAGGYEVGMRDPRLIGSAGAGSGVA
jgi:hypothetical protein